ncbi:MAG: pyridoxamine 5'-phosphate oxidase family protein [archaeon]|nr:pyridoxamine 5'-phosphate oxidase family protein [archaeon]
MAKITEEVKEVVGKSKGFAVATATKEGEPNVVPIAFGKVLSEDEVLLMDVFMKKTEENIKANPKVAVSVWDLDALKGYQFKGSARIETSGSVFDDGVKMVKSMMPELSPKAAVIVKVDSIYVTSPGPDVGKKVE